MEIVLLTALGVGSATVFGAIIGFVFKNISHKFSDMLLSLAAGIMLAASIIGLIMPSLENGNPFITIIGIISGALFLDLIDSFIPHLHNQSEALNENGINIAKANKILLFVIAIAIHNLPEGIAAGVGFGSQNYSDAFKIAIGIALQNIPEGMIIISPMLAAGIKPIKTFLIASFTGIIEVVGTLIGFFAATISQAILPFALSFAGGTMLYIISDEMIPETHSHGNQKSSTYTLLIGFCIMLMLDFYL